jgi:hypothetical protein
MYDPIKHNRCLQVLGVLLLLTTAYTTGKNNARAARFTSKNKGIPENEFNFE